MHLDEMDMTDLAALFAMMGILAADSSRGHIAVVEAYKYADTFIAIKKQREQENEDE